MRKHLLSTFMLALFALCASAQTFYTEAFNGSLDTWTATDNTGAGKWAFQTNPFTDPNYGQLDFSSPTGSNGYAFILSDGVTNAISTDLTSPAINCTGKTYVALQFTQWFFLYASATATVSVSTDGNNWTQVYNAATSSNQSNAELVNVNISQYAANQPAVYLKFSYATTNDWWWAIDDINLINLPENDASVNSVISQNYVPAGYTNLQAVVENMGGVNLTNVDLTFSVDGGTPITESFTGLNIGTFQTQTLAFTYPAALTTVGAHNITVTSSLPNDTVDVNPSNDQATKSVIALSHIPEKHVLIEEFTTVPCGYCPGGLTRIEQIMAVDSAWVHPISIHAGFYTDSMTTNDDNTLAAAFTDAAPTANIDRQLLPGGAPVAVGVQGMGTDSSDNDWKHDAEARHNVTPPVSISANNTYDNNSRLLTVNMTSTFYGPITGDFRMNCYIMEDSVTGGDNEGYDQHTYYYSSPTTLNPWLNIGTYNSTQQVYEIIGYVQHRVERLLMDAGGTWGTAGIIPSPTTDMGAYSRTFTATLPTAWRSNWISLIAFVYQYNSNYSSGMNEVQNAVYMPLNTTTSQSVNPTNFAAITPQDTAICSGQSATVTALGGGSYMWSNGTTSANLTVSPTSTTVYSVTVTRTDQSTAVGYVTIAVNSASPTWSQNLGTVSTTGGTISLVGATPAGGTFSGTGVTGNTFDPNAAGPGTYTITYTYTNGTCTGTATQSITVVATGINTIEMENAISLYPNPTKDVLVASSSLFASNKVVPVIYDVTGKIVQAASKLNANEITFNTNELPAGMYWIKFVINGQEVSKKFVKMD